MSLELQNKNSGVALYIARGRELAAKPTEPFRISHAIKEAPKLPVIDRERIGHLKFNLAKTIQSTMRNSHSIVRNNGADDMAALLTACCNILERTADIPLEATVSRNWQKGRE